MWRLVTSSRAAPRIASCSRTSACSLLESVMTVFGKRRVGTLDSVKEGATVSPSVVPKNSVCTKILSRRHRAVRHGQLSGEVRVALFKVV